MKPLRKPILMVMAFAGLGLLVSEASADDWRRVDTYRSPYSIQFGISYGNHYGRHYGPHYGYRASDYTRGPNYHYRHGNVGAHYYSPHSLYRSRSYSNFGIYYSSPHYRPSYPRHCPSTRYHRGYRY